MFAASTAKGQKGGGSPEHPWQYDQWNQQQQGEHAEHGKGGKGGKGGHGHGGHGDEGDPGFGGLGGGGPHAGYGSHEYGYGPGSGEETAQQILGLIHHVSFSFLIFVAVQHKALVTRCSTEGHYSSVYYFIHSVPVRTK